MIQQPFYEYFFLNFEVTVTNIDKSYIDKWHFIKHNYFWNLIKNTIAIAKQSILVKILEENK